MAYSLNKVQIIGNLTRDPEMRNTPGGAAVTTFSVATNFTWTDQSGQKQERVEFHNVVVWRKLAEICAQYLKKGSKVYVEGRLQTRDWTGDDGIKKYKTEIVGDNLIMLDKKGETSGSVNLDTSVSQERDHGSLDATDSASAEKVTAAGEKKDSEGDITIDDLPF